MAVKNQENPRFSGPRNFKKISRGIKIGLVQAKVSGSLAYNLDKTAKFVAQAAEKGASIVCLQELFASKYFCQSENKEMLRTAEKIPGKLSKFLSEQAKKNKIALVGGSIFEKEGSKYYNTSMTFNDKGKIIAKYRKTHIPHDPHYYEQFYFSPGNLGYAQAQVGDVKIAPLICYDQWYPEAARINALKGAQIIFYPTAIGWLKEMKELEPFSAKRWEDAMRSHSSLNGIYVAAVNRVGKEDNLTFWGSSFVADPFGQVVKKASSTKEEILVADIDLSRIKASQEGWRFLQNRKPMTYKGLSEN